MFYFSYKNDTNALTKTITIFQTNHFLAHYTGKPQLTQIYDKLAYFPPTSSYPMAFFPQPLQVMNPAGENARIQPAENLLAAVCLPIFVAR